ncbi:transglutaminase domain-containing protein, partial [bacterium]
TGIDLATLPTGSQQSTKRIPGGWIIDVKPQAGNSGAIIGKVGMPEFTGSSAYLPADDPAMIAEAKRIVGSETGVIAAAQKIRREVYRTMQPNAGIGVLRDAREVFKTKEGVCRDYAVLTATLLRAAGIPARLATGLVTWDGTFYYHAWTEVWDGKNWIGMDSASPTDRISAGHVKLSEGNVDRAFVFPVLGRAKILVLAQS